MKGNDLMGTQDEEADDTTAKDNKEVQELIDKWGDDVSAKGLSNHDLQYRSRKDADKKSD